MTIKIFSQIISLYLLLPALSYAGDTVTINIENRSNYIFLFKHSKHRQDNRFSVKPKTIGPYEKLVIKGTITADVDLEGILYFNNDDDFLSVSDHRLKHNGQPIFSMHSKKVKSKIISRTFNPSKNPLELSYIAVTLVLEPKNNLSKN